MTTPPAEADAMPILHLDLGPLDLNLLGLRVQLNEVVLNVDAIPAPGNLLGNLLAGLVSLLDAVALGALLGDLLESLVAGLTRLLEGIGGGPAPDAGAVVGPVPAVA